MSCISEGDVLARADGLLGREAQQVIDQHLSGCPSCRALVAALMKSSGVWSQPPTGVALSSHGAGGRVDPETPLERGMRLGRYLILELLGAGSSGRVYSAYDPELRRHVALKLLRESDDQGRLLHEAQALARLHHPNVVAVHDVGTADERVFLTLELLEGGTLRQWLSERRRPWREVLSALLAAGRGLAAAHAAGFLHRDFKPDNILLAADGRIVVTDFGLAKRLQDRGAAGGGATLPVSLSGDATQTADSVLVGTPVYMAPEQLEGRPADERADQFGFCVSLYEGLYGARPFQADSVAELLQKVRLGDLADATGERRVPRDLLAVVRRGLRADPRDRYPSLPALLSALERASHAGRRRLTYAAAAAAVVAVAAWAQRARVERSRCEAPAAQVAAVWGPSHSAALQSRFAAVHAAIGARTGRGAAAALNAYAASWRTEARATCEAEREGTLPKSQSAPRMRCLEDRLSELAGLAEVLEGADGALVERAERAVESLGRVEECRDPARDPQQSDPSVGVRLAAASRTMAEATALLRAYRFDSAAALVAQVRKEADALRIPSLTAWVAGWEAFVAREQGDYERARVLSEEAALAALSSQQDILAARSFVELGSLAGTKRGDLAEAQRWFRYARALLDRSPGKLELELEYAEARGWVFVYHHQSEEAVRAAEEAVDLSKRVFGARDVRHARAASLLAVAYRSAGKLEQALPVMRLALALQREQLGLDHHTVAMAELNLAQVLRALSSYDEALGLLSHASAVVEQSTGADSLRMADVLSAIGNVHVSRGDYAQAVPLQVRALAIRERKLPAVSPQLADVLSNLGGTYGLLGELSASVECLRRALKILEQLGPRDVLWARTQSDLAAALQRNGQLEEARVRSRQALALLEEQRAPSAFLANAQSVVGRVRLSQGDAKGARRTLEEAVTVAAGSPVDAALDFVYLGMARQADADAVGAREAVDRAMALSAAGAPSVRAFAEAGLARLLDAAGERQHASAQAAQARAGLALLAPQERRLALAWLPR